MQLKEVMNLVVFISEVQVNNFWYLIYEPRQLDLIGKTKRELILVIESAKKMSLATKDCSIELGLFFSTTQFHNHV